MIKVIDLVKTYDSSEKQAPALRGVTLDVKKGEIFGIIGRSAAGKSTLVRCINLLEKPSRGQVWIDGQEITAMGSRALRRTRRQIGMIFQHFNLLGSKTVYENVALPLRFSSPSLPKTHERILSLLELTDLIGQRTAYPAKLSGGQKQRVAIARALIYSPKLLLCDEATSALDPETTQNILQLLSHINQQLGLTILLITHEIDVIKTLCDRVALLDRGQIIEQGEVAHFFTNPVSALGKKFVSHALKQTLPPALEQRLQTHPKEHSHAILRILFQGHAATEPLIAYLMREMDMHLNILQANIELLKGITLGVMLAEVMGKQTSLQRGIAYLHEKGLRVEVIGYVDGSFF